MTLAETCDKLEMMLRCRPPRQEPWQLFMLWGVQWRTGVNALVALGDTLVELNQAVHDDLGQLYPHYGRFQELKARAEEVLRG